MPDQDRIDHLLSLYERRRAAGQPLSDQELRELCRQHPEDLDELRRQIGLLQVADQLLDLPHVEEDAPSASASADADAVSREETLDEPGPDRPPGGGTAHPADLPACIGPYEVGIELKKGGMGRIVRVWDVNFKRPLALKMVRGRHVQMEQRLVYEGRLTGCLQHPGIPPVHDQGRLADGRPYFIMKLIQGASLSDLLRQRTSPTAELPRFLLIFEQLCEAVGYAHSRKVIHRDLKPGNIMVGAFGEVQVIDWGLAKLVRASTTRRTESAEEPGTLFGLKQNTAVLGTQTTIGTALGTPSYMAPEQARREWDHLDARADVFGLGAILCEILTGQPPYPGREILDLLARAQRADLTEAFERLQNCGADAELVTLARACLSAAKETRPTDGAVVAQAMAAYRKAVQQRLEQEKMAKAVAAERAEAEVKLREAESARAEEEKRRRQAEEARAEEEKKLRLAESHRAEEEKKLRLAESARAEEEMRRRQAERQRRRVQLVLAVAVLLIVLGSGAAFWLFQEQRQQRAAELDRQQQLADRAVERTLTQTRLLLEQAKTSPFLDLGQFELALAEAEKAVQLASTGGACAEVSQQATALVAQIHQEQEDAERDHRLLTTLLEIHSPREGPKYQAAAQGLMVQMAEPSMDELFAAAFRIWGLDVDTTPTDKAAAILQKRPAGLLMEVVAALDEWANERHRKGFPKAQWQRLTALAQALDNAEAKHRELRTLLAEGDLTRERVLGLLGLALRPVPIPCDVRLGKERLLQLAAKTDTAQEPVLGLLTLVRALRVVGEEKQAEELLRQALQARPREVVLWHSLGQLLENQRPPRWGQVLECYVAARVLRTDLGESLAHALMQTGRAAEGLALYERLATDQPRNPWLHFRRGAALYKQKRHQEAATAYRKAIELDPKFVLVYNNLGGALYDQQDLQGAIDQYRKAIALDANQAKAHYNLGLALRDQQELEEAIHHFRKAIQIDPNFVLAYYSLGVALHDKKDLSGATAQFLKAIALAPNDAWTYHNLALVLSDQQDLAGAIDQFRKAIQINPNDAQAYYNLGVALYFLKDLAGAIDQFRKAIELDPNYAWAYNNLGLALREQQDLPGAIAQFRKAIQTDPTYAKAYYNLGLALRTQKDLVGAIDQFRKAIQHDPNFAPAYNNLGVALYDQQDLQGAIDQFRKAIQIAPNYAKAHYHLGIALLHQGQFAEAEKATHQFQKLLPPNHPWQKDAQQQLRHCARLLLAEEHLNAYLDKGQVPPSMPAQLALIDLCRTYKRYHFTATRLYAAAFTAHPALTGQLEPQHRFQAACSALLAAAGQTSDPRPRKSTEQTQLCQQALTWLRADLQQWAKWFQQRDGKALLGLVHVLPRWQQHPALAVVRDAKQRAQLTAAEQKHWQQLWADLEQLQKQGTAHVRVQPIQGTLTAKVKEQAHEVKLQAGQVYLIDLESKDFDVSLRLYNPQGKLLVANDHLAPGNLTTGLLFTAPADGAYRLLASSFEQRDTGAYTLTVRSFVARQK